MCRITIRGNRQAPAPDLPPIQGFQAVGTSSEQSFSMGPNGAESSISYLYQLAALEAGTFQIGPFGYRLDNQVHSLGPVEVTVVAGDSSGSSASARQEDFLFATLAASHSEAYVQQPVNLELSLYWRDLNLDREIGLNDFDTTGFRLGGWQELPVNRETIRGQVFEVRRFRCQAIPLTAGTFTLSPRIRVQVLVRQSRSRPDPFFGGAFDDMLFGRFRAEPADVGVPPISVVIRDLPTEGRPASFGGAVGQFRLEAIAQPREVAVGEPITLLLRVLGQGNWDTVTAPTVDASDDFRRYEAKLVGQDAAAGQKTFELVMIPKQAGITNLPGISFSYFDPVAGRFETQHQDPLPIRVAGQSASTRIIHALEETPASTQPRTTRGVDITHLKIRAPDWSAYDRPGWFNDPARRLGQVIPALVLAAGWWIGRRRERWAADPSAARRRQAPRSARRALANALTRLEDQPAPLFYEALWHVLESYFGNRFNLTPGQVSADEVSRHLLADGWSVDRIKAVAGYFEACESHRFGSQAFRSESFSSEEKQYWRTKLDQLVELMRECEKRP